MYKEFLQKRYGKKNYPKRAIHWKQQMPSKHENKSSITTPGNMKYPSKSSQNSDVRNNQVFLRLGKRSELTLLPMSAMASKSKSYDM